MAQPFSYMEIIMAGPKTSEKSVVTDALFNAFIEGATRQFSTLIPSKNYRVVPVAGDAHFRALFKADKKITFPFIAVKVTNIAADSQRYNTFAAMHVGFQGPAVNLSEKGGGFPEKRLEIKGIPVIATLALKFVTNSFNDANVYAQHLMRSITSASSSTLRFELDVSGYTIACNMSIDPNIPFPEWDLNDDTGPLFVMEFTANVPCFIGDVTRNIVINKYNVNVTTLHSSLDGVVADTETIESNLKYREGQ